MKTITSYEEAQSTIQKPFVLIIAKTHACSTCKMVNVHLKHTIKDLDSIEHYELYVDDIDQFRGEHVIFSVPTVLIYSHGKELLRESRFIDTNKVNRLIKLYQE